MFRKILKIRTPFEWFLCFSMWSALALAAYWWNDDKPPAQAYAWDAPPVRASETLRMTLYVQRDESRTCTVYFSRWLFDSQGFRYDLEGEQMATSVQIQKFFSASPELSNMAIPVPHTFAAGQGRLIIHTRWICNPMQIIHPIVKQNEFTFFVYR